MLLLNEDYYPGAKKINESVKKHIAENCNDYREILEVFEKYNPDAVETAGAPQWYNTQYDEKTVVFAMGKLAQYLDAQSFLVFDLQSGEALDWETALFKEGWKDAISSEDLKIYNNAEKVYGVSDSSIRVFYLIEGEASVRNIEIPEEYRVYKEQ